MSLELKNVEKKIGLETHIYPTNLKLQKNTINILLGSTLAGKTTLMQIMAGLDKDYTGEAWAAENINVGYLPQEPILAPNLTVRENVMHAVKDKKKIIRRF